jgi:MoaA/NifB/PqqE/SkfB family radical SAM enzyme
VILINEFADLHGENLDVSGGLEPLLSQAIFDVLKAGLRRNLKVSLYTNGIALDNPDMINHLMKISMVRISLNAYDKKSYKEVMGVDKFDVVKNNLRNLVKAKKDSHSNVRIGTSFVVFRENYKHIFEAIKLAQELDVDFFDLRSIEVTDLGDFHKEQRNELGSILGRIRRNNYSGSYDGLSVSVADTFSVVVNASDDSSRYLKEHFVNALPHFRVNVTPHGRIYALNLSGQPSRGDQRYLLGEIGEHNSLAGILRNRKCLPFDRRFLLSHDLTLMSALSKLESDLEFGIGLEENPFIWE